MIWILLCIFFRRCWKLIRFDYDSTSLLDYRQCHTVGVFLYVFPHGKKFRLFFYNTWNFPKVPGFRPTSLINIYSNYISWTRLKFRSWSCLESLTPQVQLYFSIKPSPAVTSAPFQESFSSWPTQSTTCTTPIPPLSGYYIYNFI